MDGMISLTFFVQYISTSARLHCLEFQREEKGVGERFFLPLFPFQADCSSSQLKVLPGADKRENWDRCSCVPPPLPTNVYSSGSSLLLEKHWVLCREVSSEMPTLWIAHSFLFGSLGIILSTGCSQCNNCERPLIGITWSLFTIFKNSACALGKCL